MENFVRKPHLSKDWLILLINIAKKCNTKFNQKDIKNAVKYLNENKDEEQYKNRENEYLAIIKEQMMDKT